MSQLNIQFPTKFRPLFESIWPFIIFYGGRGSGKSFSIARALVLRAYQSPVRVLCCREIQKSISDSVIQMLADQIEMLGLQNFFDVQKTQIIGQNGSRFTFAGRCKSVLVNWQDNPYFPKELMEDMEQMRERDYELYRHVYEGEPVADSDLAIIKPVWIECAVDAHLKLGFTAKGMKKVGFDVADEGADSNDNAFVHGSVVLDIEVWKNGDVIDSANRTNQSAVKFKADLIIFDSIGVGAGVKAHFKRLPKSLQVEGFNAGGAVAYPEREYIKGKKNQDMFSNIKAPILVGVAR